MKKFHLPCKTITYGYAIVFAESKEEAIKELEDCGVLQFDMMDNKSDYEYNIEDLVEE